ncbi:uncharacterized protein LOC121774031 [Salvia splendens]|uniref:uncharacterized protein LOC121774031 n=1 Tax=Salvia splendens TaxID=180675 RepID=UPI001C278C1D|nr:uncharacterized protein LOC121774031 [Salvia splendens]
MGIFFSKHETDLNQNGYSSPCRERGQRSDMALHRAALKGDWKAARELLIGNEDLIRTAITEGGEIALHIAAVEGHEYFVQNLLLNMEEEDVKTRNKKGCTALCFAAAAGHVQIAKLMLEKYPNLANIKGDNGVWPLYMAVLQGFGEMAYVLYPESNIGSWTPLEKANLLTSAIDSELYDVAEKLVREDKTLAVTSDINGVTPLQVLARNPLALSCDKSQGFWDKIITNVRSYAKMSKTDDMNVKRDASKLFACLWDAIESYERDDIEAAIHTEGAGVTDSVRAEAAAHAESARTEVAIPTESINNVTVEATESTHAETIASTGSTTDTESENNETTRVRVVDSSELFFIAAESGNDDFLVELFNNDHNLLYKVNMDRHSIFHVAVLRRYVKVFNLMYELGGTKDLLATYVDNDGNNILHLAGKLAPQNQLDTIPGAAWQMQREVMWFKEVEKLVRPASRHKKNKKGQTPHELFVAEHKGIRAEGEKFMKQTAKSCMMVTMLIATVVFTTAFTVPGGYNNSGIPILKNERMFVIFPLSEAVATLSSLTSMLMFLSILTSRYSDEDFLKALPIWMVVGVSTLFFSIVAMMALFCSCLLFFERGWVATTLLLAFFGCVPLMFVVLKYRLLMTILRCTYSCTWLFRSHNKLHSKVPSGGSWGEGSRRARPPPPDRLDNLNIP